jgi:hypothetical protein
MLLLGVASCGTDDNAGSAIDSGPPVDGTSTFDAATSDAGPQPDGGNNSSGSLVENFSPPGGGLLWTCPDGTEIALTSEKSKQSTLCLGIDGSECRAQGVPGPGDAECDDPSFNGFLGTCVAEYFSCFQPGGTCEIQGNGNQEWGNGALQDRVYMGFIASYWPSGATMPCITAELGDGIVTYTR